MPYNVVLAPTESPM